MKDRLWIRLAHNALSDSYGLAISRKADGKREVLTESGWVVQESFADNPVLLTVFEWHTEALRELASQLHALGFTPATNAIGELKATSKHLEDMRALVFKSGKP